ncbi:unnamed protein product [Oikopleura dioica]|uniref:Protein kinase domain-containing protein n=1 Tax=Oikopleura dioica TaxID=34765 RepID=E4XV29_OIKDI|nr:unnamed protein product [Oikopleura dioica]
MLTEFSKLSALTLKKDDRETLREEINKWTGCFIAKLERSSTRTDKCRLVASVERQKFINDRNAQDWKFFTFDKNKGVIFDHNNIPRESFKTTSFQKRILREDPSLEKIISRSEIREEAGKWHLTDELKMKIISEGGEAVIISENIGMVEYAVRIHAFDPFLFTKKLPFNDLKWKTHLLSDFQAATDSTQKDNAVVPVHENVVRNYANIELFHKEDLNEEDCLGWMTVVEKCESHLQATLKYEDLTLDMRKNLARGLMSGLNYLEHIGILHLDRKLSNFLLIADTIKVCDYGLVQDISGRKSYSQMGYSRKGSKYRYQGALTAGTPGFARQIQLIGNGSSDDNFYYFLFCDWMTSWSLLYKPIDERERKKIDKVIKNCNVQDLNDTSQVIDNITTIISLPHSSTAFCLDDPNLTKSNQMSSLKQKMTKFVNADLQNLTKNILDQKWSNLSVPISITTLIRFAMKNDLAFYGENQFYTFEAILTTLTMIVYPRSFAGLNLNPNKEESDFQANTIETLLERVCGKTYLRESGWEIIRKQGFPKPSKSLCKFEKSYLTKTSCFLVLYPSLVPVCSPTNLLMAFSRRKRLYSIKWCLTASRNQNHRKAITLFKILSLNMAGLCFEFRKQENIMQTNKSCLIMRLDQASSNFTETTASSCIWLMKSSEIG